MSFIPIEVTSVFEVQNVINSGAYGSVIKVMKKSINNLGNQRHYAMKIVTIDPRDSKSLKNAESELQVLLEIKNPYTINLDSYFKVSDKIYFVMDYCPNHDLLRCISDKQYENQDFEEDEIWKYFIQASFGVEALHSNNFIHRDIKPDNILLDENKEVKLGDFGLSRYLEATSVRGTLPYYSPRMCKGEVSSKESDIWALGCVLYYLCNLEIPFNGHFGKIIKDPYFPIKSQYSKELKYFVDWCLKKERNARPTINEILTHDFIVNKAIELGIRIPKTSAMSTLIRNLLKTEREKKLKLQSKSPERNIETIKNEEIMSLKAEIARLKNIIIEKGSELETFRLKTIEIANFLEKCKRTLNRKEMIEAKSYIGALIAKAEQSKKAFNCLVENLNPKETAQIESIAAQNLIGKRSNIFESSNNSVELEYEFRSVCLEYTNNSKTHDTLAMRAYEDYLSTYKIKTSLFNLSQIDKNRAFLLIYNTETETQESKILKAELGQGTCITQLPNGKLFCFGKNAYFGITLLIDVNNDYKVEKLPFGAGCYDSSAIYFNNNVYCFGGYYDNKNLTLSQRFDLRWKQWNNLTPLPKSDLCCNSIIFNGSILISGYENKNLLRYSIDGNSFTTIPYEFAGQKRKILINAERLYLIECNRGSIYESEIGSDTAWRLIRMTDWSIDVDPYQTYCQYNKGGIYIGLISWNPNKYLCFKFDLNEKTFNKLLENYIK